MLTYKQLAEKLGVKKDTVIYRARKLPPESIIKKDNRNYLTEAAIKTITEAIEAAKSPTNSQAIDALTVQLANKDQQIKELNQQLTKSQQLLDQQQQLTANLQTKLDDTTKQLTTVEAKHWWQRLFS